MDKIADLAVDKLNVSGTIIVKKTQPINIANTTFTQNSIMNFVQSKKPISLSRSKEIDEPVTKMIVKG